MGERDPFPASKWEYNGDMDARSRVKRVLDHHRINFWMPDGSIRFVSMNERIPRDVERAIAGYDASCKCVNTMGQMHRYRVTFNDDRNN